MEICGNIRINMKEARTDMIIDISQKYSNAEVYKLLSGKGRCFERKQQQKNPDQTMKLDEKVAD